MARARNIKPGLFKNELLVEQPPFVRLLFIGLWTLADREGRLEDRPKRIKLELFPYDPDDTDQALQLLAESGFIDRYEAVGKRVIQIVNFLKHQTPHGTERDSELPGKDGEYTVHERNEAGYVTGTKRNNNVNQIKNNVSAQGFDGGTPVTEHPDSLIHRFTDSPNKESTPKDISDPRPPRKKKDAGFDMMKALADLGVNEKFAADWMAVRKAKRAASTQTSLDGLVREAGKAGISVDDAVRICGERGWQSFDSTWNWQPQHSGQKKTQYQINQEATARAFFGSSVGADEPRLIHGEVIR